MYKEFSIVYDELMKGQVDYKLLASNILNICIENDLKVNSILECAMGSGLLTEEFLKMKIKVDGFDISDDMLSLAYNKLLSYENVNIYKGDVKTFFINKKYDFICCFFDCINYLKSINDIENFFKNVYKQMDEKSIFMFDLNSEYKLREYLANNVFIVDDKNIFYTWENKLTKEFIDFNINFFIKNESDYKRIHEKQRQYIYSKEDIEKLIKKLNFKIIKKIDFDNFKRLKKTSYRILYVLKKDI